MFWFAVYSAYTLTLANLNAGKHQTPFSKPRNEIIFKLFVMSKIISHEFMEFRLSQTTSMVFEQ